LDLSIAGGVGHLATQRPRQPGHVRGIGWREPREVEPELIAEGRAQLSLRAHVDGDRKQTGHLCEVSPAPELGHRLADQGHAPADLPRGARVSRWGSDEALVLEARPTRRYGWTARRDRRHRRERSKIFQARPRDAAALEEPARSPIGYEGRRRVAPGHRALVTVEMVEVRQQVLS